LVIDLGDAIERDPEVRQARMIAVAARSQLMACMSSPEDEIDLVEAQAMLDALRNARTLARDAEDRVLLHRGLLTAAAADRRAARRHPGNQRLTTSRLNTGRLSAVRLIAAALALALAGVVGLTLARRCGVRLPLARW
jgi:hypothetical protein